MTLDDRFLREHLERRAQAGAIDVTTLTEAVLAGSAGRAQAPRLRRLDSRILGIGVAAVLAVAMIGAVILVPPRLWPSPGTSADASPGASLDASPRATGGDLTGYPSEHALTTDELFAVVLDEPRTQVGTLLIADVSINGLPMLCPYAGTTTTCDAFFEIRSPGRSRAIPVHIGRASLGSAPYAVRVGIDFSLEFVGSVQPGPERLAWTTSELGVRISDIRSVAAANSVAHLVSGWLWTVGDYRRCLLERSARPSPVEFTWPCGQSRAFLTPANAVPPDPIWGPVPSSWLRLQNLVATQYADATGPIEGFWLVEVSADALCEGCSSLGGANLIGRVLPAGRPAPSESVSEASPTS